MTSGRTRLTAVVSVLIGAWLVSVGFAASDSTKASDGTTVARASTKLSAFGITNHSKTPHSPAMELAQALALQRATPAAGARGGPAMVEDVFTNVQALKGISVDEFMHTMGLMSAALSYCCSNCHPDAGTSLVKWESDADPKKKTARQMVFMVDAINKQNFQGRQVVTCWTCHRGRDFPVVTARMDALYSEAVTELDDIITKADGVPAPAQIIDKYLQAIGGAQKAAAITSISATGKAVAFGSFGGGGTFEFFAQAPDKRATYLNIPDGESVRTFDGKTGWLAVPLAIVRKYPLLTSELEGARVDAQLSFPTQITKFLTALRTGPLTDIDGKDTYVVQGNGQKGSLASLYFDKDSGLLVRVIRYVPTKIGRVPTQVDYSDYREAGGIKFPYKWTFTWLDGRDNLEFGDVKFNVPIAAAKFGEPTITR